MTQEVTGIFNTTSWEEKTYREIDGEKKLTKVEMVQQCTGELTGESSIEYLMFYPDKDTSRYLGLEHFQGKLGEREGSFVVEYTGVYQNGIVHQEGTIVEGSGTGGFEGVTGEVKATIDGHNDYPITYTFHFPQ
ncbi:MAG: DUF3224 domain-containing protein [Deltaproteobacteria bacterium]|nr:MAG: DUF3224 domain-containing protein [Deltaproteobacteria bacterium]